MEKIFTFLSLPEVMAIHKNQIENYGGSLGVRDEGMLEAALSQPSSGFGGEFLHPDIYSMAGAYLYHIAQNHPFVDGNKRVATVSALVFLELNGYELNVSEDLLEETVLGVASSKIKKDELVEFFKDNTSKIEE